MSVHWADFQQATFTRWVNSHLSRRGLHCNKLDTDFKDGVLLCNLLEIISSKSLGRWHLHPKVPAQKVENCVIGIEFVKSQNIKLVNIGGEDIADGKIRLILGLIWTLILRFQINLGDEMSSAESELLKWVQSKIPSYNIKNFTSDWNSGIAINALVNALEPSVCKDHASMSPQNALQNAKQGIEQAEQHLGIPQLVTPQEMTHPKVDKLAMITYISKFREMEGKKLSDANRCHAWGPGLVEAIVNKETNFLVDVFHGATGKVTVEIIAPNGEKLPYKLQEHKQQANSFHQNVEYDVFYTPAVVGRHTIHVRYNDAPIQGSPFYPIVLLHESLGGEGKIRVFFSTTSSTEKGRQDNFKLEKLLTAKQVHLRDDFEPWVPVDVLEREDREAVFRRAGTRTLPIVFIDDVYIGDYDRLQELEDAGKLDAMLNFDKSKTAHIVPVIPRKTNIGFVSTAQASAPAAPVKIDASAHTVKAEVKKANADLGLTSAPTSAPASSSSSSASAVSSSRPVVAASANKPAAAEPIKPSIGSVRDAINKFNLK